MTTPTGIAWTFPLQLRAMLAASASFRTWIGAADVTTASAAIGFYEDDEPVQRLTGDRFGFIDPGRGPLSGVRDSTGAGIEAFALSSMVAAWGLEWRVDEFTAENTITFRNLESAILQELLAQAEARNVQRFEQWAPEVYPLKRLDGDVCRYQIAYTFTARQGTAA